MSPEEARKVIDEWVSKRAQEITLKAQEDMEEIAQTAKINLSAEIDRLARQAEAFDSMFPFKLIDIITGGGLVESEIFNTHHDYDYLAVTVADKSLFVKKRPTHIQLGKGRYKAILIVEKLDEPKAE